MSKNIIIYYSEEWGSGFIHAKMVKHFVKATKKLNPVQKWVNLITWLHTASILAAFVAPVAVFVAPVAVFVAMFAVFVAIWLFVESIRAFNVWHFSSV